MDKHAPPPSITTPVSLVFSCLLKDSVQLTSAFEFTTFEHSENRGRRKFLDRKLKKKFHLSKAQKRQRKHCLLLTIVGTSP